MTTSSTNRTAPRRILAACVVAGLLLGLAPHAGAAESAPPYVDEFGEGGTGDGQFNGILALAVDDDGNWYAGDYYQGRIEKFTAGGDFVQVIGAPGAGDGQLNHANGLVVYHDEAADVDRLLVSDASNSRLVVFGLDGTWIRNVTSVTGATPTNFSSPAGLTVAPDGRIYVADRIGKRIVVMHNDFTIDHEIELDPLYPFGVAVSPTGDEAYVVDSGENVTVYDTATWAATGTIGNTGPVDEQVDFPYHVNTDEIGFLYVGNEAGTNVQKFAPSGRFIWTLDPLSNPFGIVYQGVPTASGLLGVTDSGHNKVQVFDLCPGGFSDVPESHPFWFEICWMDTAGISTGYGDGTYRPVDAVSRQAMAAFLYRSAGEPPFTPPVTATFPDVPVGSQFFTEVEWMVDEGIATGYADGKFHPTAAVSRQAMSAFMYRAAGSPAFTPPVTPTFDDVATTHAFFDEIEWMAEEGITTGFPDGTYRPVDAVTRQAMSAFLARLALVT